MPPKSRRNCGFIVSTAGSLPLTVNLGDDGNIEGSRSRPWPCLACVILSSRVSQHLGCRGSTATMTVRARPRPSLRLCSQPSWVSSSRGLRLRTLRVSPFADPYLTAGIRSRLPNPILAVDSRFQGCLCPLLAGMQSNPICTPSVFTAQAQAGRSARTVFNSGFSPIFNSSRSWTLPDSSRTVRKLERCPIRCYSGPSAPCSHAALR